MTKRRTEIGENDLPNGTAHKARAVLFAGVLAAGVHSASAVPSIDWHSIDCGGGVSTAGLLEVRGSIGQPDAGPALTSGTLELRGGFLAIESPTQGSDGCNQADLAEPFGILDLTDINMFITGFLAQDPISDLDGNGLLDLSDIGMFLSQFVGGCP